MYNICFKLTSNLAHLLKEVKCFLSVDKGEFH
jgi:hypothetical protein